MKIGAIRIQPRFYITWAGPDDDLRRGLQQVVFELKKIRCYDGMTLSWSPIAWADKYNYGISWEPQPKGKEAMSDIRANCSRIQNALD